MAQYWADVPRSPFTVTLRAYARSELTAEKLFYVPDLGHMLILTLICHFSFYLRRFPRSSYNLAPIPWHVITVEVFCVIHKHEESLFLTFCPFNPTEPHTWTF